ncbi:hypothetical protein SKAU_G00330940 [Synaphobranchus kaupii]|uniref:Uncharacterized protein n=1 Tax=Synaphobranchus kaupii TaxID=118154 RepID=A0A9Q1EL72_SYNKA|nr:hypothetical protein SKAU_G00330940 [Synaphobranchus kaupii]
MHYSPGKGADQGSCSHITAPWQRAQWSLRDGILAGLWTLGNVETYRSRLCSHLRQVSSLIVEHCHHRPTGVAVRRIEWTFCMAGFPLTLAAVDACRIRVAEPLEEDGHLARLRRQEVTLHHADRLCRSQLSLRTRHRGTSQAAGPTRRVYRQTDGPGAHGGGLRGAHGGGLSVPPVPTPDDPVPGQRAAVCGTGAV